MELITARNPTASDALFYVIGGRGGQKNETETISFSKDTAKKTGKTERAIMNHAKIGKELSGVADQLRDTPFEGSQTL